MNWLEKIQPWKLYRYVFYRLNIFSKKFGNDSPEFSTMLIVILTIIPQVLFLFLTLGLFLGYNLWILLFEDASFLGIIIFMCSFLILGYYLFYYKKKWKRFIKEFEKENERDSLIGKYYLFIYLFISVSLFYGCTWLVTFNNPNYNF